MNIDSENINTFWKNFDKMMDELEIPKENVENVKNKINILKIQLEEIAKIENYNLLENIIPDFLDLFYELGYKTFVQFVNILNLSEKERIMIYIKIYESKSSLGTILYKLLSTLLIDFIDSNEDSFIKLLNDEELQNQFSIWFKEETSSHTINSDILEKILKLPKIQENVLQDPKFYNGRNSFTLFNLIPKEYGSAIAFYDPYNIEEHEEEFEQLYSKYFNGVLTKSEQLELIKEHIIELNKHDLFELGKVKKMLPFHHLLNCIIKNKEYYTWIKNIKNNSNLDFDIILKFLYKYDETNLFKNLYLSNETYNKDKIDKIKYLSEENKLVNCEDIENLDDVTLFELQSLPKGKGDNIVINIAGGPTGKNGMIFKDGYKREVRRVDIDGTVSIIDGTEMRHEEAVKFAYSDIEFDSNCTMAIERAVEAVKQLSTITFIIENEMCYLIANDNISEEQFESLNNLIPYDKNSSRFGIILYNSNEDNYTVAYNGESVTFDKMIDYMKSLRSKNKAVTH